MFQDLTVRETVGLAVPGVKPWQRVARTEADEVIAFLGLGAFVDRFINELSTGTRRIVELACLLAADPVVLLLDEPSAGVAQRDAEALAPLLMRVRDETGASLKAAGFRIVAQRPARAGWDTPSRPRDNSRYRSVKRQLWERVA